MKKFKCRELRFEDLGIGGNWGEEEEMGDKFLGKDEKENSKEDRVEIKKKEKKTKKTEKTRKDEKRRSFLGEARGERREKKKSKKKEDT